MGLSGYTCDAEPSTAPPSAPQWCHSLGFEPRAPELGWLGLVLRPDLGSPRGAERLFLFSQVLSCFV